MTMLIKWGYDVIVGIWVYPSMSIGILGFCLMVVALDSHTTGFFIPIYDVIVGIWVYPSTSIGILGFLSDGGGT
jgi:hypothetical protein